MGPKKEGTSEDDMVAIVLIKNIFHIEDTQVII
jgi:hypothetical protein